MPDTPEEIARANIDAQLAAAGWVVQNVAELKLFGQDQSAWGAHLRRAKRARRVRQQRKLPNQFTPETWAIATMNMIIHDMEGQIEIGDTFKNLEFSTFDRHCHAR